MGNKYVEKYRCSHVSLPNNGIARPLRPKTIPKPKPKSK